jgi:hypothetical protein
LDETLTDAFHLRSDMTFPHVGQSSLFFTMFVLLLIEQKMHTQFLKFLPPPFFMGLEGFKEKYFPSFPSKNYEIHRKIHKKSINR